jgi:4-amino-4-deoxy-L-arabinose transferase-like glycosyltransferase
VTPATRRVVAVVGALLLVALAARVGVVLATSDVQVANDGVDYVRHAGSIAAGNGYPPSEIATGNQPSAYRPPAWPYLLGGAFALAGREVQTGRLTQALVGTALVALAGLVAFQLWGSAVALLTLAVGAIYPPLVIGASTLLSEPLFVVFELGALAAILHFRRVERLRWTAAAGALVGLAILTRTNGAVLLLPLAVAAWGSPRLSWRAARAPAIAFACAALAVAPWTIRNAIEFDEFIPVAAQGGITLAGTYNDASRNDPRFPGAWRPPNLDPAVAALIDRTRAEGEPAVNDALGGEAREYALDHPGYVAEVVWLNTLRVLALDGSDYNRQSTAAEYGLGPRWSDLATYGFFVFGAIALIGMLTPAARRAPWWVWATPLLAIAAILFASSTQRFRQPLDPFIAMLAALAFNAALARRRANRAARPARARPASPAPFDPS